MEERKSLEALSPEWIHDGETERAGVSFDCPAHGPPCRLAAYFSIPGGGGASVTETNGRPLHQREGDLFDELSFFPPLRHGEWLVFCFEGGVVAG